MRSRRLANQRSKSGGQSGIREAFVNVFVAPIGHQSRFTDEFVEFVRRAHFHAVLYKCIQEDTIIHSVMYITAYINTNRGMRLC